MDKVLLKIILAHSNWMTHNHSYTTGFEDPPRSQTVMTEKCYHGVYPSSAYVDLHGGNESRPFNSAVNFVIKY